MLNKRPNTLTEGCGPVYLERGDKGRGHMWSQCADAWKLRGHLYCTPSADACNLHRRRGTITNAVGEALCTYDQDALVLKDGCECKEWKLYIVHNSSPLNEVKKVVGEGQSMRRLVKDGGRSGVPCELDRFVTLTLSSMHVCAEWFHQLRAGHSSVAGGGRESTVLLTAETRTMEKENEPRLLSLNAVQAAPSIELAAIWDDLDEHNKTNIINAAAKRRKTLKDA